MVVFPLVSLHTLKNKCAHLNLHAWLTAVPPTRFCPFLKNLTFRLAGPLVVVCVCVFFLEGASFRLV